MTTTFTYDAENRLYSIANSSTTTKFLYDGQDLIAETNVSGAVLHRYVHGSRIDDPIVWYEGSGTATKYYFHQNHQGSVVGITDQSGAAYAINAYDEYGNQASGNIGRFQYTGQVWLGEVDLYSYKARLYDPRIGRFLQADPIGYGDNMNLHAYVGNDPLNFTDPSGLDSCDTERPDGTPGPRIPNCIGDADGPNTPEDEAEDVIEEITVVAKRINKPRKDQDGFERLVRSSIRSRDGEVGFFTIDGNFISFALEKKCTRQGNLEGYKFPDYVWNMPGPITGIGHVHSSGHLTGYGLHDASAALQKGLNIEADRDGVRGIAKLSTGSALAFSVNGDWGDAGAESTQRFVDELASAEKGKTNAGAASNPGCN